jgi:hypothetical protein
MFSDYIRWPAFVGLIVLSGLTMLVHFTGPSHDWSEYANNLVTFVELEFCAFLVVGALSQLHNDPSPVWHGVYGAAVLPMSRTVGADLVGWPKVCEQAS